MAVERELGDLTPIRGVLSWLDEQADSIAAPAESVRLMSEIQRKLSAALDEAQNADLDGLTVEEYARLSGASKATIYKRVQRGQIQAIRRGRSVRIPITDQAAA